MKLTIDNLQGQGSIDYSAWVDAAVAPHIERLLNRPSEMTLCVVPCAAGFVPPVAGARITLSKTNGSFIFTGYLIDAPTCEYVGWGQQAPVYRYRLRALSDEVLLDAKALPNRAPFTARSAGSALKQMAQDLLPGEFNTDAVEDLDKLAAYAVNPQKKFSYHAGEIALAARAAYRAVNGSLQLSPVGSNCCTIDEADPHFSPSGLSLVQASTIVNDVTVVGLDEPQAYVRDYFVGDGLSLRFYLSQTPFQQSRLPLIDEEFAGSALDAATWVVSDPASAISVAAQALQVNGGNGLDGKTTVSFLEEVELGGALKLQHGDVSFTGPSRGVIGGLYAGAISSATCLAGFQITPNGSQSNIQALINGSPTGPVVTTSTGHRYVLTTYFYSREVYRSGETYHSSAHPAGNGLGGASVASDVRVVLELQDVNPVVPSTLVAAPTVLYDNVISNAAGFCTYTLVNSINLKCSIAFTYVTHIALAEVRSALPSASYSTQIVGSLSDGAQCSIASSSSLDFYPQYVPPLNTLIVASYRGSGRAVAEVVNAVSIAGLAGGSDDGTRGMVRVVKNPSTRTQADCENAALAMLDDAGSSVWSGSYRTWSDFLPSAAGDVFPGDGLVVNVPSQGASFSAVVRKVGIDIMDPASDHSMYSVEFANDFAAPLAHELSGSTSVVPLQDMPPRLTTTQVGNYYLASLSDAQITEVSSTTAQVDVGTAIARGCGVEVRAHDYGFGSANDRNLLGRFTTQTFTLPRLARTQTYFLRLYDSSTPPRYSRYSAALHVDYPYE
ncbi:MAG TPA: hypothetical protein VGS27_12660 [Candidatus Sulfotelmatobacter sp.]|nr:hypothetical protein [Candidatus Sulfotelmatobacter sp.]